MNLKTLDRFCFVFVLLGFLFSACQPELSSPQNPENVTQTVPPEPTPEPTDSDVLVVPVGEPEAIDGVLSAGEWESAVQEAFADGSEILLMHKDGYLYVAIRGNTAEAIAGNVYLSTGDEIAIYHTSAALGTGRYEWDGAGWQLAQAFDWRCRDTSDSETARNALEAFFQDEGWVSINSWMGTPNELEYKISLPDGNFRLAANFLTATTDAVKIPWPQDVADDSTVIMTTGLPQELAFTPEAWRGVDIVE